MYTGTVALQYPWLNFFSFLFECLLFLPKKFDSPLIYLSLDLNFFLLFVKPWHLSLQKNIFFSISGSVFINLFFFFFLSNHISNIRHFFFEKRFKLKKKNHISNLLCLVLILFRVKRVKRVYIKCHLLLLLVKS